MTEPWIPKYLARRLESPGILVFREKHGNRFFVCNTPEDFGKAALKILKERLKDGWYWDEEYSKEELDKVESAGYLGITKPRMRILECDKTEAETIIKNNDWVAAFIFMERRSDHEYENMDIEHPETY